MFSYTSAVSNRVGNVALIDSAWKRHKDKSAERNMNEVGFYIAKDDWGIFNIVDEDERIINQN